MVADLLEVTVKGGAFLVQVDGIFGGICIDDEPPLVSAPKEGGGGSYLPGLSAPCRLLRCCSQSERARNGRHRFHVLFPRSAEAPGPFSGDWRHCNPHSLPPPDRLPGAAVGATNDPYAMVKKEGAHIPKDCGPVHPRHSAVNIKPWF